LLSTLKFATGARSWAAQKSNWPRRSLRSATRLSGFAFSWRTEHWGRGLPKVEVLRARCSGLLALLPHPADLDAASSEPLQGMLCSRRHQSACKASSVARQCPPRGPTIGEAQSLNPGRHWIQRKCRRPAQWSTRLGQGPPLAPADGQPFAGRPRRAQAAENRL